jgi:hypothetical protein
MDLRASAVQDLIAARNELRQEAADQFPGDEHWQAV